MMRDWCGGTDGTWWRHLPAAAKAPVVAGAIAAYELAYNEGQFNTMSDFVTAYSSDTDRKADSQFHHLVAGDRGVTFGKSVPEYVAAIDRFYKTYPAKINLKIVGVLRCLRDRAEASCDEVGKSDLLPWPTGV